MKRTGWRRALGGLIAAGALLPAAVHADVTTYGYDVARTGWDATSGTITPNFVGGPYFGTRYSTAVDGMVMAQPLVYQGIVIVATQHDMVYGINALTGTVLWQQKVGTFEPASVIGCPDVAPAVGVTATPVLDSSTGIVYLAARSWDGSNAGSATWKMWALNATTGAPITTPGWPVNLAGVAGNDTALTFDPVVHLQRPALLLLDGRVYAAFGSYCDNNPYQGWVIGVSTVTQHLTLWTSEALPSSANAGGGIWQSGGGLVSDGSQRIFLVAGNGQAPPVPGPGSTASPSYGDSAVRLDVSTADPALDATLTAADHFTPGNQASLLSADFDIGSLAPAALPDSMGVPGHPHLLVTGGKDGRVFLLDRDNLGGYAGPNGSDNVVAVAVGYEGALSHPAVWPGDGQGSFIYVTGTLPHNGLLPTLRAYKINSDSSGHVSLDMVAAAPTAHGFGFGSGSPVITSDNTASGSALVWVLERPNYSEPFAELRAYAADPVGGVLQEVVHIPVGQASKFSSPTADGGQLFVGTADGHLLAFGLSATPGPTPTPPEKAAKPTNGYNILTNDGGIYSFGDAQYFGNLIDHPYPNHGTPIAIAEMPDNDGYDLLTTTGAIYTFGDAPYFGNLIDHHYAGTPTSVSMTPSGKGYAILCSSGAIYTFGDAQYWGNLIDHPYAHAGPPIAIAYTSTGKGYVIMTSDGAIFTFGDAVYYGNDLDHGYGGQVAALAETQDAGGYFIATSDGGLYSFGDAPYQGNLIDHQYGGTPSGISTTP